MATSTQPCLKHQLTTSSVISSPAAALPRPAAAQPSKHRADHAGPLIPRAVHTPVRGPPSPPPHDCAIESDDITPQMPRAMIAPGAGGARDSPARTGASQAEVGQSPGALSRSSSGRVDPSLCARLRDAGATPVLSRAATPLRHLATMQSRLNTTRSTRSEETGARSPLVGSVSPGQPAASGTRAASGAQQLSKRARRALLPALDYEVSNGLAPMRVQWVSACVAANAPVEDGQFLFHHAESGAVICGQLDGHGGPRCVAFMASMLPERIMAKMPKLCTEPGIRRALVQGFAEAEAAWLEHVHDLATQAQAQRAPQDLPSAIAGLSPLSTAPGAPLARRAWDDGGRGISNAGTCACVAVLHGNILAVANVGDCRAVLATTADPCSVGADLPAEQDDGAAAGGSAVVGRKRRRSPKQAAALIPIEPYFMQGSECLSAHEVVQYAERKPAMPDMAELAANAYVRAVGAMVQSNRTMPALAASHSRAALVRSGPSGKPPLTPDTYQRMKKLPASQHTVAEAPADPAAAITAAGTARQLTPTLAGSRRARKMIRAATAPTRPDSGSDTGSAAPHCAPAVQRAGIAAGAAAGAGAADPAMVGPAVYALQLTRPHNTGQALERHFVGMLQTERRSSGMPGDCYPIKNSGGRAGPMRVAGSLAVTRALGDLYLKHKDYCQERLAAFVPYIVGSPDITTYTLTGSELFLILGSDGVWEHIAPSDAVDAVLEPLQCAHLHRHHEASGSSATSPRQTRAAVNHAACAFLHSSASRSRPIPEEASACSTGGSGAAYSAQPGTDTVRSAVWGLSQVDGALRVPEWDLRESQASQSSSQNSQGTASYRPRADSSTARALAQASSQAPPGPGMTDEASAIVRGFKSNAAERVVGASLGATAKLQCTSIAKLLQSRCPGQGRRAAMDDTSAMVVMLPGAQQLLMPGSTGCELESAQQTLLDIWSKPE